MASIQDKSIPGDMDKVDPMMTRPYHITRVMKDTYDTFTLEMENSSGKAQNFTPGQFNMLYVFGVGEVPISISGDPGDISKLVHTTRAVGSVTKAMQKLKAGDNLGVRGPFGSNWPVEEAKGHDVVIIAGGIGLAPLRPVIYHILNNRKEYGKFVLLYGARTPKDVLYSKQLSKWSTRSDFDVQVTVDRGTGTWKGLVGVVPALLKKASFDPLRSIAMTCGPEIMMRFTILELEKKGIEDDRIFVSMERNMKCGIGLCGHCQIGPTFVCKDGPVYNYNKVMNIFTKREI
jgi:NAD(P)H-flavin reductase